MSAARGRSRGTSLVACLLVCAGVAILAGCKSKPSDAAPQPSAANPSASAVPSAFARAAVPPPPKLAKCRAISVGGSPKLVALDGGPLVVANAGPTDAGTVASLVAESADLPDDAWILLEPGSKLTAKHPRTTRETSFVGPGRARSCVARGEEAWLAEGTFDSVASAGERPGAEEWVVTPVGVVRYGVAKVEIVVTAGTAAVPAKAEVRVTNGAAYVWTGDVASAVRPPEVLPPGFPTLPDGWIRLEGTRAVTLTGKKAGRAEALADAAVAKCVESAKVSRELAIAVANPDSGLKDVAPKHVMARQVARAACGVAALRVTALPVSSARTKLEATLSEPDADWRSGRPRAPHGRQP